MGWDGVIECSERALVYSREYVASRTTQWGGNRKFYLSYQ